LTSYPLEASFLILAWFEHGVGHNTIKKIFTMGIKNPWHSVKQPVYHNHSECNTGNNIEKENWRSGTGGKRLCDECKDWARK